ncbi:uncharacterized protein [Typha angustifolia]|uniref:uncharacterized protein n=1 Tax=Typha angustifolia TaxID=59011 RepID=UPI003C2C9B06
MHLTNIITDVIGVITISLATINALLGLICIYRILYFQLWIRRRGFLQLTYFNGPWVTRVILILVSIWCGFGEIIRLSYLNGRGRIFSSLQWQKNVCKFYILSNLGFAEPSMFLMLAFLLHAALQKRESDTLSRRWNRRTIFHIILFCLPVFVCQFATVFIGPKINSDGKNENTKIAEFFTRTSSLADGIVTCVYPLLSTIFLGAFYVILISYVAYVGTRMLSLVINKGLRRRIYVLLFSLFLFPPWRALLLGFSVLPTPGGLAYEAIVFLAFLVLLFCTTVGIFLLVYFPVADTLALGDPENSEMEAMPYDE